LGYVLRHLILGKDACCYYDKLAAEVVYIVDTDGSLYSNADAYDPRLCHGNIFSQPISEMRESEGYGRAVANAHARMRGTCTKCELFGACSGYFMAEATPEQRWRDEAGNLLCGVARPVQKYILEKLIYAGVVDLSSGKLRLERVNAELKRFLTEEDGQIQTAAL
jgi:uncharacterized protein